MDFYYNPKLVQGQRDFRHLAAQFVPEAGAGPPDAGHDLDDRVAAPRAPAVDGHPRVDALLRKLRARDPICKEDIA